MIARHRKAISKACACRSVSRNAAMDIQMRWYTVEDTGYFCEDAGCIKRATGKGKEKRGDENERLAKVKRREEMKESRKHRSHTWNHEYLAAHEMLIT